MAVSVLNTFFCKYKESLNTYKNVSEYKEVSEYKNAPKYKNVSEYKKVSEYKNVSEYIVTRNGNIVWKHGPYWWYFCLNLKYRGWPYRAYIKTAENENFCKELLSKNDFEPALATFCCYGHGAKTSEEVQNIAIDQKEYRTCSLCVIICWITRIYSYLSINKQWGMVGYRDNSDVAKKAAEIAQKKER